MLCYLFAFLLLPAIIANTMNSHLTSLIRCHNQTKCISPEFQLQEKYKVYYCKHTNSGGVRFFYLAREGLLLHPNIQLVNTPEEAEYIIYLPVSAIWKKSECSRPEFANKTIILDEGDYPNLFVPDNVRQIQELYPDLKEKHSYYYMYFKRSCVQRSHGIFSHYMNYFQSHHHVYPMTYTIMESYPRVDFANILERKREIVCTLRGSDHDTARKRVVEWVKEYAISRGVKEYIAGEVNHASRTVMDSTYFGTMHHAQIIVTCNPSHWEGDFRFMEAMASGALVFVDRMETPRPHPLLNDEHVIYYDNSNKTDIFEKLDFYRANVMAARKIAISGYVHSMQYHRAASLMDYVFRSVSFRRSRENWEKSKATGRIGHKEFHSPYTETAFDMKQKILSVMKHKG